MVAEQCDKCYVGRCQPAVLPYMRMFGMHMVILPNAPANKCDVCGNVEFQPEFLMTMQVMLEEIAKAQRSAMVKQGPVADRPPEWTPAGRGR
jgi:hypothetical protein